MSDALHQSVGDRQQKPGRPARIGSDAVGKKSPPDGYTIVVAGHRQSHTGQDHETQSCPTIRSRTSARSSNYGSYPAAMMASTALPVKDLGRVRRLIARPRRMALFDRHSRRRGPLSHVYGQLLASKDRSQVELSFPTAATPPARLDLLAGNIHGISSTPDFRPDRRKGKKRRD